MPKITYQDFIRAAREGDLTLIQTYQQQGGDLHLNQDEMLRWSANSGHLPVVKYLLTKGADVHANNDQALRWGAEEGHLPVVQILIEYGANIHKGINAVQHQPLILSWLEDYQRMQHEQLLLSAVETITAPQLKPQRL